MEQVQTNPSIPNQPISPNPQQIEQCAFTGTGDGYAKVFFVNLALNILTLGFYSPWAKVRRLKYFHHHTVLAGSSFEYTANPWSIFKGRLIVLGLFIVFSIFSAVPILNIVISLAFIVIMPRLLLQTYRFRARYSEYRGLKFHFNGTTWEVFLYSVLYRFLAVIPLGLLVPAARAAERRYVMSQLQFGTAPFKGRTTSGDFWGVYLTTMAIGAIAVAPALALMLAHIFMTEFFTHEPGQSASESFSSFFLAGLAIVVYAGALCVITPLFHTLVAKVTWNGATVGDATVTYTPNTLPVIKVGLVNAALALCTLGLAYPWQAQRVYKVLSAFVERRFRPSVIRQPMSWTWTSISGSSRCRPIV